MTPRKLYFLNDHETAVDLLYYEAISRTIAKFIGQSSGVPLTIGVHGDWGAGKSSILKMVSSAFVGKDRTLCVWFNGWSFEGFEDAKAVIIETLVAELRRARPASAKVAEAAKKVLRRVDWLKIARKAGGLAVTAATGIPATGIVNTLYATTKALLEKPQDHINAADIANVAETAGQFLKANEGEPESVPEQVYKFREEFEELLKAAELDQLIVLIDDLDRCLPQTSIATLEAIRLFLFVPRTAFVIAADEAMIEYSVRQHFPELPNPMPGAASYARSYLEKLIQVPFRVPSLGLAETRAYITLLLSGADIGEDTPEFQKLLAAAREDLRRPWESGGLDRAVVRKALQGEPPPPVDQALRISEQITRLLTDGTRGNPRQIKRFLNSMMLRKAVAEARGFGDDIQVPVLAKVMLAERFLPEFYEYIARTAAANAKGTIPLLARLEASLHSSGKRKNDADDTPEDEGWSKSEAVKDWAQIEPRLGEIDLRPYIFVSRDKRSYFAGVVASDHLDALIGRLLGTAMVVRQAESEIARLTQSESEQVFDVLRSRIFATDNLASAPSGVAGIALLVRKHPPLQRRLLGLLRDLPTDKTGAWAVTSWSTCFVDVAMTAEFAALRSSWATSATNTSLKAAAQAVPKVRGT